MPHPFRPENPAEPPDPRLAYAAEPVLAAAAAEEARAAAAPGLLVLGRTGDPLLDGLLWFHGWSGGSVTYGDPDEVADYGAEGPYFGDFAPISAAQLTAAHAILDASLYDQPPGGVGNSVEGLTGLALDYLGGGSGEAVIRLAVSGALPAVSAAALVPETDASAGDAFFGVDLRNPVAGNAAYTALVHELGHTLGLMHGHEEGVFGKLPDAWDSMEFTVMTYRAAIGADGFFTNETWGYPQSYMMLDIAALQHIYGADFETTAGDTTYRWDPATGRSYVDGALAIAPGANRVFQTIWDGGGTDVYDLSNYRTNLVVDLAPGGHSTLAEGQLAFLGGGPNGGYARGNVFNALQHQGDPRSLIENAVGGSGDDEIRGNVAANALDGGAGNDRLYGDDGDDALYGGRGADVLDGGRGVDVMRGGAGADAYHVDDARDVATETNAGGGDIVFASVSYALGAGIEDLTLVGAARDGRGNEGANVLLGNGRGNLLEGDGGRDLLRGMNGDDVLRGGRDADVLRGGAGADRFDFDDVSWSTWRDFDVIAPEGGAAAMQGVGRAGGDVIDLSGIDADANRPGDQAFVWGSTGVGGLSLVDAGGGVTRVRGNVAAAEGFEFRIDIEDGATISAADYLASDFVL